jgi:hypothetical protein
MLCCPAGVRLGAANTLRGLSRSVRILRGTALTSNLAPPLMALLQDSSATDVQVRERGRRAHGSLSVPRQQSVLLQLGQKSGVERAGKGGNMLEARSGPVEWRCCRIARQPTCGWR